MSDKQGATEQYIGGGYPVVGDLVFTREGNGPFEVHEIDEVMIRIGVKGVSLGWTRISEVGGVVRQS